MTPSPGSTSHGCSSRGRCREPLLPVAIEAATKSDEDKLSTALGRLAAEDPSLRIEHNPETRQLVLWVMGESHAEVALDRLQRALRGERRAA